MSENIIRLTADPEFLEFLKKSVELIDKMPDWKKGCLEASSRSTNSIPREPVVDTVSEQQIYNLRYVIQNKNAQGALRFTDYEHFCNFANNNNTDNRYYVEVVDGDYVMLSLPTRPGDLYQIENAKKHMKHMKRVKH